MDGTEDHTASSELSSGIEAVKERFLQLFPDCHYPEDRLTLKGRLGSGAFARVFDCTLKEGNRERRVAVKKMDPGLFQDGQNAWDFFRETQLLSAARERQHPNILAFIGISFAALEDNTEPSLCIIEEFMNHGTLKSLIENRLRKADACSEKERLELILHVARGLAFLHDSSVSVIHRDIKPANVLINKDPETGKLTAKLADFGLSVLVYGKQDENQSPVEMDEGQTITKRPTAVQQLVHTISGMLEFRKLFELSRQSSRLHNSGPKAVTQFFSLTGQTGSLPYMAPEVFCDEPYNHAADVFSFGILSFETLNLLHPHFLRLLENKQINHTEVSDASAMEDYASNVADGYRAKLGEKWPEDLSQLLQDCWAQNPEHRPAMHVVVTKLEEIYKNCAEGVFLKSESRCCCLFKFL